MAIVWMLSYLAVFMLGGQAVLAGLYTYNLYQRKQAAARMKSSTPRADSKTHYTNPNFVNN